MTLHHAVSVPLPGCSVINLPVDSGLVHQASTFLKHAEMVITPRKQVAPI